MKRVFFSIMAVAVILAACSSSHKVTSFWVDKDAKPAEPYKSIFIATLTPNVNAKRYIENEMAKRIIARGQKAVKSTDIFTPKYMGKDTLTGERLTKAIKESGCDGVITIALLDVKSETSYHQGTAYYPSAGYYGGYGRYYGHYYYMPYAPGYYEENKTYFIETNFFDATKDKLLISIQSEAYNPSSLESFFRSYAHALQYKLKEEGLLKK